MIVAAALRHKDNKYEIHFIMGPTRHSQVLDKMSEEGVFQERDHKDYIYGFCNEQGEFLDRNEAAKEAFRCGQISKALHTLKSYNIW